MRKLEGLEHAQPRVVLVLLVHVRHKARQVRQYLLAVVVVVLDVARERDVVSHGEPAAEDLHQSRLARARLAEYECDAARLERARDATQDLLFHDRLLGEAARDALDDLVPQRRQLVAFGRCRGHCDARREAQVLEPHGDARDRTAERVFDDLSQRLVHGLDAAGHERVSAHEVLRVERCATGAARGRLALRGRAFAIVIVIVALGAQPLAVEPRQPHVRVVARIHGSIRLWRLRNRDLWQRGDQIMPLQRIARAMMMQCYCHELSDYAER